MSTASTYTRVLCEILGMVKSLLEDPEVKADLEKELPPIALKIIEAALKLVMDIAGCKQNQ